MKYYDVEQGSARWYQLRIGRPTASNFHRVVTAKGEPSKQAMAYLYRLVAEKLLNETLDDDIGYVSYVRDGREREPQAVALFSFTNDVELYHGGFITTDDGRIGCSPDRLFRGMKEGVEIKCPAPQTLLKYHMEGLGDDYRAQVQGQLLVGEFQAVHFFAYHPQMPHFHKVTLPDRNYQAALRSALGAFCDALDVMYERARLLGAYAVTRRAVTPAEIAYGEEPIKIVNPEVGEQEGGA